MNKLSSSLSIVALLVVASCKKESASEAAPSPVTKNAEPTVQAAVQTPSLTPPPSPSPDPEESEDFESGEDSPQPEPSKCANVDLSDALDNSPADAHAAIQRIAAAIKSGTDNLETLIGDPVRNDGLLNDPGLLRDYIGGKGALEAFELAHSQALDAATDKVACLVTLQAQKGKGGTIELFAGSGYGKTKVVRLGKQNGAWRIVETATIDLGAP